MGCTFIKKYKKRIKVRSRINFVLEVTRWQRFHLSERLRKRERHTDSRLARRTVEHNSEGGFSAGHFCENRAPSQGQSYCPSPQTARLQPVTTKTPSSLWKHKAVFLGLRKILLPKPSQLPTVGLQQEFETKLQFREISLFCQTHKGHKS